jgi:hypothetical protein
MANEIQLQSATGRTVYGVIFRDSDQQVYNGSGFEALDGDNWGDYDVALTEVGTTGIYRGTFPVVASANYSVLIYWQQAGSPATSDVLIGIQPVAWSGTAVASLLASQVVGKVAATLAAADVSGNLPARLADSVTHGGTSAVLSISNLLITTTGSTNAIEITGSGSGDGLAFTRSGSGDVFDANFEAAFEAFAAAGAVTAIGSENVVTTANLPANFASLLITSDGYISRVVLVDTTTTNTDMRGTDNAFLAANYTAPDNAGITTAAAQATAANSAIGALVVPTANQNADALLDRANAIETGWTPRQVLRVIGSTTAGELSGAGTATEVFRALDDSKARVTATVDENGNRTAITFDKT